MRNVFDQYGQPENRLTHALFASLAHDDRLLRSFIKDVCKVSRPAKSPAEKISVQRYPDGTEYSDDEVRSARIPDAWIYDDDGWALVFEIKIGANLTSEQLRGHRRKASQLGYDRAEFFCILGDEKGIIPDSGWTALRWSDVYVWLRSMRIGDKGKNDWAGIAAEYFEILEAQLMEKDTLGDAELTAFSGFFSNGNDYSYPRAKAQLRRAMGILGKSKKLVKELGMLPDSGRGAIKEDDGYVWDVLRIRGDEEGSHTENPHLTLGVMRREVEAMVTFPHGLRTPVRNNLKDLGHGGLEKLFNAILQRMKRMNGVLSIEPKARPIVRVHQERWHKGRSLPPITDASLEFDLRTLIRDDKEQPKHQPKWLDAAIETFFFAKKSNQEFQVGVSFAYEDCPTMSKPKAAKLVADSWLACKPIIDAALEGQT